MYQSSNLTSEYNNYYNNVKFTGSAFESADTGTATLLYLILLVMMGMNAIQAINGHHLI
jgi:hypothetical protein